MHRNKEVGRDRRRWRSQKGDFSRIRLSRGDTDRFFPKLQRATASRFLRKSSPEGKNASTSMLETSRRPSQPSPSVSLCLSCTTCAGCSSRSKGTPISCIRASSIRTLTSTPRMPWLCSGRPGSRPSSKTSKVFLRTGFLMAR